MEQVSRSGIRLESEIAVRDGFDTLHKSKSIVHFSSPDSDLIGPTWR